MLVGMCQCRGTSDEGVSARRRMRAGLETCTWCYMLCERVSAHVARLCAMDVWGAGTCLAEVVMCAIIMLVVAVVRTRATVDAHGRVVAVQGCGHARGGLAQVRGRGIEAWAAEGWGAQVRLAMADAAPACGQEVILSTADRGDRGRRGARDVPREPDQ